MCNTWYITVIMFNQLFVRSNSYLDLKTILFTDKRGWEDHVSRKDQVDGTWF